MSAWRLATKMIVNTVAQIALSRRMELAEVELRAGEEEVLRDRVAELGMRAKSWRQFFIAREGRGTQVFCTATSELGSYGSETNIFEVSRRRVAEPAFATWFFTGCL
jgi:hypothetical protein